MINMGVLSKFMRRCMGFRVLGVILVLVGIFLPREWYDALPKRAELPPPPIKGVTLLQITFVLEGLALIWFSFKQWAFTSVGESERLAIPKTPNEKEKINHRISLWLLLAIISLAIFFRFFHINSSLWLDEITPILFYGHLSALEVIGTFLATNNHLLNTILVNMSVALFGEHEWAIRLPAVIFGIATIPTIYWVARMVLSRTASLCVALLLTVSYHHIFFSQNARGYSAYLLLSLLSSGLLVKGLQEDKARTWILYVVTMFFNIASLMLSSFVIASHIIVGMVVLIIVKRNGISPMPLLRRLASVFVVIAFLGFQLYATILPQVYVMINFAYVKQTSGFQLFSMEFLREMIRGISTGFGTGLLFGAIPFLIISCAGFIVILRRHWAITMAITMPGILTVIFLIVKGMTFSPRFFLLAIPVAILATVQGIFSFSKLVANKVGKSKDIFSSRLAIALVLVMSVISITSLKNYYSVPKQAYKESIQYIETKRQSDEIVIVIHLAEKGYRYYGKRFGIKEGGNYFFVRSVAALDAVLASHSNKRSILVTTFHRAFRIMYPDLKKRIAKGWEVDRAFPGTIGDGQISVWKQRPALSNYF